MANPSFTRCTASFRGVHTANFPRAACFRQWLLLGAATSSSPRSTLSWAKYLCRVLPDFGRFFISSHQVNAPLAGSYTKNFVCHCKWLPTRGSWGAPAPSVSQPGGVQRGVPAESWSWMSLAKLGWLGNFPVRTCCSGAELSSSPSTVPRILSLFCSTWGWAVCTGCEGRQKRSLPCFTSLLP